MDDATKQALSDFIQKALAATEQAGEFAVAQAPLVVQEYILRGFTAAVFWAVVSAIAVILAAAVVRRAIRSASPKGVMDRPETGIPVIFAVIIGGMSTFTLVGNIYDALMIYIAPRVYILEQLRGLL